MLSLISHPAAPCQSIILSNLSQYPVKLFSVKQQDDKGYRRKGVDYIIPKTKGLKGRQVHIRRRFGAIIRRWADGVCSENIVLDRLDVVVRSWERLTEVVASACLYLAVLRLVLTVLLSRKRATESRNH
jgi:hypothetical protein